MKLKHILEEPDLWNLTNIVQSLARFKPLHSVLTDSRGGEGSGLLFVTMQGDDQEYNQAYRVLKRNLYFLFRSRNERVLGENNIAIPKVNGYRPMRGLEWYKPLFTSRSGLTQDGYTSEVYLVDNRLITDYHTFIESIKKGECPSYLKGEIRDLS